MTILKDGWWLVADVGGTNVRFARAGKDCELRDVRRFLTRDFGGFQPVLHAYLRAIEGEGPCRGAAIAAAGPVDEGVVKLTNSPWVIANWDVQDELEGVAGQRLQPDAIILLNDLAAVARGLPYLKKSEVEPIGEATDQRNGSGPMFAANVGTGFGAATVTSIGYAWSVGSSEAGHMTYVPAAGEEDLIGFSGQSVESVLSGSGVLNVYSKIAGGHADMSNIQHAGNVFRRAEGDQAARRVVEAFTNVLGRYCGDLVLATGSWGGVYLTGSVVESWAQFGSQTAFRQAFEDKGLMRDRMANTPTYLIKLDNPALVGLARSLA